MKELAVDTGSAASESRAEVGRSAGRLMKNSAILTIGTLLGGVFSYLFHFIISRKLSVAAYGELQSLHALFMILTVGASTLNYFFLKFFSVFAQAGDRVAHRAFLRWVNRQMPRVLVGALCILALLIPVFMHLLRLPDAWGLVFLMAAIAAVLPATVYTSALTGWEYFFLASVSGVATALAKLSIGAALASGIPTAAAAMASYPLSALIGIAITVTLHRRMFGTADTRESDGENWREKYVFSYDLKKNLTYVFIFSFLLIVLSNADVLLVKRFASAELTGYYGALRTLGALVLTANMAVVSAILPSACADGHARKSISVRSLLFCYAIITAVSGASALVYAFFPEFVVGLLYGSQYARVAGDLWLFCPLVFFLSLLTFEANLAYARHDFSVSFILAGTLLLTGGGVAFFHGSISQIALTTTAALTIGSAATLVLNMRHRRRELAEPFAVEPIPSR